MNPFMTSFPDDAECSKIMLLSLEEGEIDILYLPKKYERSEKKRTNPFVLSAAAEAARPRFAMRGYIGKGKASSLFSTSGI